MIRLAARLPILLLRYLLAFSLAVPPLGYVLAGTDAAIPDPQPSMGCHHQGQDAPAQDGCCHYKGSKCHCATAATLPATPLPALSPWVGAQPTASSQFCLHTLSIPETPPPRS